MSDPDDDTMTVEEELLVQSVTIKNDGMADVLYDRTLTNTDTNEVIVRDVVREIVQVDKLKNLDYFVNAAKAVDYAGVGHATMTVHKKQIF